MKKIINLLIIAVAILCLAGCEFNITDNNGKDPDGTGNTETPVVYPYMDYFENTVYAMKYFGKDGSGTTTHGTFKDSWFAAIGQTGMSDVTASTPCSFNDKDYGGLCFTAKTGIEVETITFTIVAEQECYIQIYLFAPRIDEDGDYELWNNSIVTSSSKVAFKNNNFTTADGTKLIKLSPNTPMTFTVDTLCEEGEVLNRGEEDFGKITDSCADDETARRILLSAIPYRINNGYLGEYFSPDEFAAATLGIRIYNVSFEVKKL